VAGNTGHGVYPDDEATLFLNAAKIPELALTSGGAGAAITVGASVSINTLIDKLSSAKAAESGGISSHQVLATHLGKVANNQVRNVGSWAGNLALCHANPTFQSDIATIMTAAGATVQIADAKGALTTHSLSEFYAMDDFTMLVSLTIPPASAGPLRTYIDASAALKMPGVIDFISASDLGPNSNFTQPVITPLKTVLGGRKIFADQPMQQVADGESQSQN